MTFRDAPWPDGTPCWIDMLVPDQRMALDFYGALFAWDFADQGDESGNYLMCSVNGRTVAGIGGMPPDRETPVAWTTYLASTDVDRTAEEITKAGGRVEVPPMDVLGAGRMAVATDPSGGVFGVWQAGAHPGIQVADLPRTFTWAECRTDDREAAKLFYANAFGHEFEDVDGQDYARIKAGGNLIGGLGAPSEQASPHWAVYFGTEDTDAAANRVVELGGSVVRPPYDLPYGRAAEVTDNQGAAFALISVPQNP